MYDLKQLKTGVLKTQFKCMLHYLYTSNEKSIWKIHFTVFFKTILIRKKWFHSNLDLNMQIIAF